MKRGTPRHPKTKDLARRLKIPVPYAVGILEMLWHFTADFCPRGDIGHLKDEDIADAVGWPEHDSATIITALCESGWLNVAELPDRLVVHDWHEHADDYTKKKIKESGRVFASVQKILENSGKFTATLPCPALPSPAEPCAESPPLDAWFEEVYARHPKKRDRILAEQAIASGIAAGTINRIDFDRAHKAWCSTEAWKDKSGQFAPSLAAWIQDQGYKFMPEGQSVKPPKKKPKLAPVQSIDPEEKEFDEWRQQTHGY